MYFYRITKYNPENRNSKGDYLNEEWTSFYDINKCFGGKILTPNSYLLVEELYIDTISMFMKLNDVEILKVNGLEGYFNEKEILKDDEYLDEKDIKVFNLVKNDLYIDEEHIRVLCKLILREHLWCKLKSDDMFVHFGYDYYMYIGSFKEVGFIHKDISELGLYIEKSKSLYI